MFGFGSGASLEAFPARLERQEALRGAGRAILCRRGTRPALGLPSTLALPVASSGMPQIPAALAEFERGVIRERTLAGLQAARARGRTGGRPPALKAKDLAAAKALLLDPEITVVQVAKRLGVAASTLYRHLPRARTAALEA